MAEWKSLIIDSLNMSNDLQNKIPLLEQLRDETSPGGTT